MKSLKCSIQPSFSSSKYNKYRVRSPVGSSVRGAQVPSTPTTPASPYAQLLNCLLDFVPYTCCTWPTAKILCVVLKTPMKSLKLPPHPTPNPPILFFSLLSLTTNTLSTIIARYSSRRRGARRISRDNGGKGVGSEREKREEEDWGIGRRVIGVFSTTHRIFAVGQVQQV
jgi:hypothetical protein